MNTNDYESIKKQLLNALNEKETENGDKAFNSTLNKYFDIFVAISRKATSSFHIYEEVSISSTAVFVVFFCARIIPTKIVTPPIV